MKSRDWSFSTLTLSSMSMTTYWVGSGIGPLSDAACLQGGCTPSSTVTYPMQWRWVIHQLTSPRLLVIPPNFSEDLCRADWSREVALLEWR